MWERLKRNRFWGGTNNKRGRVLLHIGRNKAGSTTLQDLCLNEHAWLRSQGVSYAMFGHLSQSRPHLPGFATFEALAAHATAYPDERHLVSNEFMFGWPDEFTGAAVGALSSCDVRILAYIRPYDAWVVSAYAEETRKGMNSRNIDEYIEWFWPRVSAWTYLDTWGRCFGWDRIYLRDLNPASLYRGDLCADFLKAIGVPAMDRAPPSSNLSPHWMELELARRLTERDGDVEWIGLARDELEPLLDLLRPLVDAEPPATYLSLAQRRRLVELYNKDLSRIEAAGGPKLTPASIPTSEERGAPPAFADVPAPLLQAFFKQAASSDFARAFPAAAARAARLAGEMSGRFGDSHGRSAC